MGTEGAADLPQCTLQHIFEATKMRRTLLLQHLPVTQAKQRQALTAAVINVFLAAAASDLGSPLWRAALLEGDIELRLEAPSLLLGPVLCRLRLLRSLCKPLHGGLPLLLSGFVLSHLLAHQPCLPLRPAGIRRELGGRAALLIGADLHLVPLRARDHELAAQRPEGFIMPLWVCEAIPNRRPHLSLGPSPVFLRRGGWLPLPTSKLLQGAHRG